MTMASGEQAREALYAASKAASEQSSQVSAEAGAKLLLAAAVAFRAASGGNQVGAINLGS